MSILTIITLGCEYKIKINLDDCIDFYIFYNNLTKILSKLDNILEKLDNNNIVYIYKDQIICVDNYNYIFNNIYNNINCNNNINIIFKKSLKIYSTFQMITL